MEDKKVKKEDDETVGQVGSSLAGGFEDNKNEEGTLTNKNLKGKKVDADPNEEKDKPPEP